MQRSEYLEFRRRFEPTTIQLVIVAESPPVSGQYFYRPEGAKDPLFAALMRQLGFVATTKESGLRELQRRGWMLVDATYERVNADGMDRDAVIIRDYPRLHEDLAALLPERATAVVLVKANVCQLLEDRLVKDGFNVINRGSRVPFPSHGNQPKFHAQFSEILRAASANRAKP